MTDFLKGEQHVATLSELALRRLIAGGETATVELKVASPRPVEMASDCVGWQTLEAAW